MTHIIVVTRFRLSAAQMSVIWPGLDLIVMSYNSRHHRGGARYGYPFRVYPPPVGFARGTFDQFMMDEIVALWKRLHPKSKAGGRVHMDTIELRASIFAIRAKIDFVLKGRHSHRRLSLEAKTRFLLDDESFDQLKIRSQRLILTLERHLKRANRALQKSVPRDAFAALTDAWRMHLRWMWVHIAYFKPFSPVVRGRRLQQQRILDELMQMAEHGIRNEGYEPPDAKELRRMMRLYVSSARRGRESFYTASYLLNRKLWFTANRYLGRFVLDRLTLKEIQTT